MMVRMMFRKILCTAAKLVALLLLPLASLAQSDLPSGPVRFVVPFPAGGPAGLVARVIADKLSVAIGQPILLDHRPGAGANIGTDIVAKSAPNGQTLLLGTNGPLVINQSLYAKLPFDPLKDFAPITLVATIPIVLVAHPSVPVSSMKELIAYAKSHPGELSYASSGSGSGGHLAGALLAQMAGASMTHVAYSGVAPATTDTLGGHTKLMFAGLLQVLPYIKSGQLKALGMATPQRVPFMSEVPTIAESGLPGFEITSWYAVLAPAGTPRPMIDRLNKEIVRIIDMPDVSDQLFVKGGMVRVADTPDQFAETLRREAVDYARIVKIAGAKAQ